MNAELKWFESGWRRRDALVIAAILWLGAFLPGSGRAADLRPAEFQAAFLAKSLAYVTWPDDRLPSPQEPMVIGLLNYDPFDGLLQKLLENQKINHRSVLVKTIAAEESFNNYHVVFVPGDQLDAWNAKIATANPHGLLTVGADDSGNFLQTGGIFNLLVSERRLEISLKNAKRSDLEINSKLIKISRVVR